LEAHVRCKGYKDADGFDAGNRSKRLVVVNTLLLSVTLDHQLCLVACSSSLFLNTHLTPITGLSLGLGTRCQTLVGSNWFSSSCIAQTHSDSFSASTYSLSSINETKLLKAQILLIKQS